MNKLNYSILLFALVLNSIAQTDHSSLKIEQPKTPEEYSRESKKSYMIAAAAFGFVILSAVIRTYLNKTQEKNNS